MRARPVRRLAICPCPPVLLPGATGREAVPECDRLLAGVRTASDWLCELDEPLLVLTSGPGTRVVSGTTLSARCFGLAYTAPLGRGGAGIESEYAPHQPGLLIASLLLADREVYGLEVADPDEAYRQAREREPAAVLVLGGGSARRRDGAPGYLDERAVPYDDELADRIAAADLTALAAADLTLADDLLCDVARPLSVAARLCADADTPVRGMLDSYDAPYGVANYIARWSIDA